MTRQEANQHIIKLLTSIIEENSDLRWAQLMPPTMSFYEESTETLKKMEELFSGVSSNRRGPFTTSDKIEDALNEHYRNNLGEVEIWISPEFNAQMKKEFCTDLDMNAYVSRHGWHQVYVINGLINEIVLYPI